MKDQRLSDLARQFEAKAGVADAGAKHGLDTQNADQQLISKAEARVWRQAAAMVEALEKPSPASRWPDRCPYADIPGERPCKAHSYSGCSDDGTGPRARG